MTHPITLPRYIALCGNPLSGKSTVQEILRRDYGVVPVDDGHAIRSIAVEHMGLTWDQVRTQAGKRETVQLAGRDWVVRDLLGQIGNRLEDLLGPHAMPFLSERQVAMKPGHFSFGSVRRDQGRYYQERHGVVIEVANPNAAPLPLRVRPIRPIRRRPHDRERRALPTHAGEDGVRRAPGAARPARRLARPGHEDRRVMARWFDFWLRSMTTGHALTLAYWTAVSREASALMEDQR